MNKDINKYRLETKSSYMKALSKVLTDIDSTISIQDAIEFINGCEIHSRSAKYIIDYYIYKDMHKIDYFDKNNEDISKDNILDSIRDIELLKTFAITGYQLATGIAYKKRGD